MSTSPASQLTLRAGLAADRGAILAVAEATGLFAAEDMSELAETLDGYLSGAAPSDRWVVGEIGPDVVAIGYYAPERMTRGTWNLYLLAVHPDRHGTGLGRSVVRFVEEDLRAEGARLLIIETSGTAEFAGQRAFYSRLGYRQEAVIAQFYDAGDDKVTFLRELTTT